MRRAAMYAGSFDPPTEAHHAIMRSAVRDHGVERLIVAVNNVTSPKIFKCSAEQRRDLVVAGLHPEIADRVEVVIEPPQGKNALFDDLRKDRRYTWVSVIGEDSFRMLTPATRDRRRWLVFDRPGPRARTDAPNVSHVRLCEATRWISSTTVRSALEKGESVQALVRPGAAALIAARGYYAMPAAAALAERMQRFDALWTAMAGVQTALVRPGFAPTQSPEEAPNYIARYLAGKIAPVHGTSVKRRPGDKRPRQPRDR